MEPHHQRERSRHPRRVCRGALRKIDLRSRSFLSAQALYVENRLIEDRRQRTATTVHHRAESQSRQPQRDSGSDPIPAVDQLYEPSDG